MLIRSIVLYNLNHERQQHPTGSPFFHGKQYGSITALLPGRAWFCHDLAMAPGGRIEWCWLQREGAALMLQQYPKESHRAGVLGMGVSICFICADALALYHEFTEKGLTPSGPFVGNKMWVTSLKDPDGYDLQFESMTDVREETTYSEWLKINH